MTGEPSEARSRRWLAIPVLLGLAIAAYFGFRAMTLSNADQTVTKAEQAVANGESKQARSLLGWLLYFDPNHKGALMAASASYAREQKHTEAIELFDRVPESDLESGERYVKASYLINDGQWDRAEALLVEAMSRDDSNMVLVDQLARLYLSQMRSDDAIEILDRHLVASGENTALMSLLELLAVSQSPDAYLGPLGAADERWPGQKSVMLALANCHMLSGQTESASAMFEKLVDLLPDDLDVQIAAAGFQMASGETAKAQALLDRVVTNPKAEQHHQYWFLRARLAEAAGDVVVATSHVDRAIGLTAPREDYLQTAARLARRAGLRGQAGKIGAQAAQLAQQRQRLMKLFPRIDASGPKAELFNEIAVIVEDLGYADQATRWRGLAERSP